MWVLCNGLILKMKLILNITVLASSNFKIYVVDLMSVEDNNNKVEQPICVVVEKKLVLLNALVT